MNKALEKEAEKYISMKQKPITKYDLVAFAEKRIAELEKRCANYEMTISKMEKGTCDICKETEKDKKIEALEQQIEKMKRCAICKHSTDLGYCKIRCSGGECDNHSSWEIKENE